jgi:hypothetical protein
MSAENMLPGTVLCRYDNKTCLIGVSWGQLVEYKDKIFNWKYNRPYDPLRVKEIAKIMSESNYVDGIIYIVYNDTDPTNKYFECYDGIHRIETLKFLDIKDHDRIYNHKILIHYTSDYNDSAIKMKFETLNKCLPVPEIYSNASRQLDMIQKMEFISSHYIKLYSNHFSGNKKTNIPNENRDIFIEKLSHFIKDNRLEHLTNQNIIEIIDKYNNIMKENYKFYKLTQKQYEKCIKHNCFLFISKRWDHSLDKLYQNKLIRMT